MTRQRLYLAGPLFSAAERDFNERLRNALVDHFEVYLPQEDGGLLVDMVAEGVSMAEATRRVFRMDVAALDWCDCLLITLDGRCIDEGASFELGYAFAKGKRCIALQTDPRRLMLGGNNPMIDASVEATFHSFDELLDWARLSHRSDPRSVERVEVSS